MFVNREITEGVKRQEMTYGQSMMITLGVNSYEKAVEEAKKLVAEDIKLLELCGGFGYRGVGMIKEAVDGAIPVGVITFDHHPGYDHESGDVRWLGAKG
jgi:predicted methyltransferase